jgi:hypothetical protein
MGQLLLVQAQAQLLDMMERLHPAAHLGLVHLPGGGGGAQARRGGGIGETGGQGEDARRVHEQGGAVDLEVQGTGGRRPRRR